MPASTRKAHTHIGRTKQSAVYSTVTAPGRKLKYLTGRITTTKPVKIAGSFFAKARHHGAHRPHMHLMNKLDWYRRWHSWNWKGLHHGHVHGIAAAAWLLSLIIAFFSISQNAYAFNTWIQTDWSGGVGASTTNQYSAASNIDTSGSGQFALGQKSDWCNNSHCNTSWQYRKKLSLDNTDSNLGVTSETLTNFPILVKLDASNIDYSHFQPDGDDIRFTDSSGADLSYEVEQWDTNGNSFIWVKVPTVDANSDTSFVYLYYGNASATNHLSASGVWKSDYRGVYHLNQSSGTTVIDSTSNAKNGTKSGAGQPAGATGEIGIGQFFGGGSKISLPSMSANLAGGGQNTISFWMDLQGPGEQAVFAWGNAYYDLITVNTGAGGPSQRCFGFNTGAGDCYGTEIGQATGGWKYITAVFNNGSVNLNKLYVDGQQLTLSQMRGSAAYKSVTNDAGNIGDLNGAGYYFVGNLDEFRLSVNQPTTAWVAADYKTNSLDFVAFGNEEELFSVSGTLTSNIYDLSYGGDWGALTYTTSGTGTVIVKVRSSNSSSMSGAADFSTCPSLTSGTDLTGQACMGNNERYVQYQITLSGDGGSTPTFEEIGIAYDPWDTVPPDTNASSILMYKSNGGDSVASNGWVNSSPYFSWTTGVDNGGGSGIKGHCLYLGQDNTADLTTTKGLLGTSPLDTNGACQFAIASTSIDLATINYLQAALTTSSSSYYLLVKAIDNANNVFAGSAEQFQFRFDNTPPTNPAYVTAPSQFINTKTATITWPATGSDAANDAHAGLAGLQYRINNTTWYGDAHNGNQDSTDLLTNDGSYTTVSSPDFANINEGNNPVYFRSWDQAGNVSTATVTTSLKINTTGAPSAPQSITATPTTNTTNSFAFSWVAPATFVGSASNITYCYTVNTLPTSNNCSFTAAGVTSLPAGAYATQPGDNTFYVVAKDESGNINYATAGSTVFTANTSAPGMPLNVEIADVSTRATSNWKVALSWAVPVDQGSGVATYKVMRSTDGNSFAQIATTAGLSYVDGGLSQTRYYYKISACDSANNCGAYSTVTNIIPTGKFTEPAEMLSNPVVSEVTTKRAKITWVTNRESDSKIAIGTSSGSYFASEISNSSQVTSHIVDLDNLKAGTTYFFVARWTDEDGNTGVSNEISFTTAPAPIVKNVKVIKTTLNSATVQFTSEDASKALVYYGKTDAFGGKTEINTSLSESTYQVELNGLDDGASYVLRISLLDSEGGEYTGDIYSFTTPPRPAISNLKFQPVKDQPTSTQLVSWTTNVPTSSTVNYGKNGTEGKTIANSKLVTEHEMTINDLQDNSDYFLIAESRDVAGNLATSDRQTFKTALDTRPPKISNLRIEASIKGTGVEARGQAVVSWTTDEPATSQVAYGQGASLQNLNNRTGGANSLTTEHVVIVSDLSTSSVYTMQPVSRDGSNNEAQGSTKSAIIGKASESIISIVLNALRGIFGF